MKEVTIENVKASIALLEGTERACGLTLKGEFELACLRKLVALMQSAQVAHDAEPSFDAMMRALDAFYADDDVPERAMLAAFKILLADVRGQVQEPATDNTAPAATVSVPDEIRLLQSEVTIWKDRWELLRELFREVADALGCDVKDQEAMLNKIEMLQGAEPSPATDNTAQQFEALATSAPSTPTFTAEELKSFGREMWFDGWRTSPHTPSPNYDCNQAFRGTDVAERLTTSAGSGKQ